MSWWIINLTQVGKDCLSDLDTNVKDGYECYDWLSIWYRMGLIDYLIWILMLRMDMNVMMDYKFDTGWNVEKDGYKCYIGLWIWYWLGLIVYLIWILMLRIDINVMMDYEFDIGWNVEKDGYKCYDGLWTWIRLGLIV